MGQASVNWRPLQVGRWGAGRLLHGGPALRSPRLVGGIGPGGTGEECSTGGSPILEQCSKVRERDKEDNPRSLPGYILGAPGGGEPGHIEDQDQVQAEPSWS